jgi:hypothetical protein
VSATGNRYKGAKAGAVICAVARFTVTLAFVFYVSRWGGRFWADMESAWFTAIISGVIGLPIGFAAGYTCKPLLGTLIGAALSGGVCLTLFAVPTNLMIAMSYSGDSDRTGTTEVWVGFLAMIIAGAVSGGIGAAIGRRAGTPE